MIFGLLVLALVTAPIYTPGAVRPLTTKEVCAIHWRSDRRHVTVAMKKEVARRYGLSWSERSRVEFDHLVPRSLGGSDSVDNLWTQPWPDARKKDKREAALSRAVCAGTISLKAAQDEMRHWGR